jgi:basic membrane protein A
MRRFIIPTIAAALLLAACGSGSSTSDSSASSSSSGSAAGVKTAFVYVSPVKGSLWTQAWDKAREELASKGAETSAVEPIPETADATGVLNDLVSKGNKLIFATAFGYQPFVLDVATANPDVDFVVIGPWIQEKARPSNVTAVASDNWAARYALGVLAAKTTKSGTLGFVAANPISTVIASVNAFQLGARSVNPAITTKVVFTGTWYDPPRATQAAQGLAGAGADVIAQYEDSTGTLQGTEKAGVWGIGSEANGSLAAPKSYLSGSINNWIPFANDVYASTLAGTFKGADAFATIADGGVTLGPINAAVPQDVKTLTEETMTKVGSGDIVPFTGPIKSNTGEQKLAAGQSWADSVAVLKNQDFLVEGIVGNIPG